MKPVMLALSSFRYSENPVRLAIEKAKDCGKLVIVYVVDVNLARYLIGSDLGIFPHLKERCEEEMLEEYRMKARERIERIAEDAAGEGVQVKTHVRTGRFAAECLEVVEEEEPGCIVTTRSKRPKWVKRFFGSPVDYLVAHAPCPVIEA